MKRIMYFRLATKEVHLPKLIGALIVFAALFLFLKAGAHMFDSWDAIKEYPGCVQKIELLADVNGLTGFEATQLHYSYGQYYQSRYTHCKDALYNITGVQLKGDQTKISSRQFFVALLGPIAEVFLWAVVFILGIIFYRTGTIVIPIEESIKEVGKR